MGEDTFGSSSLKEDSSSLKEDSQQPVQRKVMFSAREELCHLNVGMQLKQAAHSSCAPAVDSSAETSELESTPSTTKVDGGTGCDPQASYVKAVARNQCGVAAVDSEGLVPVKSRRARKGNLGKTEVRSRNSAARGLTGAKRAVCKAYHLSNVSPDSSDEDMVAYCRSRGVTVTGCYLIRTRVWGTRSMKVFAESTAETTILHEQFWPEHVCCRLWTTLPPRASGSATSIDGAVLNHSQ